MTTKTRKARVSGIAYGLKTLTSEGPGVYEAIVSVFGNVDYAKDRVLFGAFAGSLERWKSSGDPIPVVFAHQWDDLDAHVGVVLAAEELAPGDARLPVELMANGGLLTKFRLDIEEDFAGRLAKRLDRRSIREFSFAYDVLTERRSSDGVNDLVELDLIEVGPCLKGMNPDTALLARKALAGDLEGEELLDGMIANLVELGDVDTAKALAKTISHTFVASPEDSSRCVLCGLTRSTVGHLNFLADEPDGTKTGEKASVTFVGSVEERQDAVLEAVYGWAIDGDIGNGGFYALHHEATFDDRVVFVVEGWNDPIGEGTAFEASYVFTDGVATIETPVEVVIEATTRAKTRTSAWRDDEGAMVLAEPKTGKGKAGNAEDPRTSVEEPGSDPVLVDLAIAEVELEAEGAPSTT